MIRQIVEEIDEFIDEMGTDYYKICSRLAFLYRFV